MYGSGGRGGPRGGSGNGSGTGSQNGVSKDCEKQAKSLLGEDGWRAAQELMRTPPLFDIDRLPGMFGPGASFRLGSGGAMFESSMSNDVGSRWFGELANLVKQCRKLSIDSERVRLGQCEVLG